MKKGWLGPGGFRTDHQDEIGPLWERVSDSELVEDANKEVTSLLVFPQLSFEELVLDRPLQSGSGSFLKRGIRAENNPGAGCQGRVYDRGWGNQPAHSPPSSGEGL